MEVTVCCAEGDVGFIYDQVLDFEKIEIDLNSLPVLKTPVMLNVGSPTNAFHFSHLPNAGVGLAREEFIIANFIQAHPNALLRSKQPDPELEK
mmetsp:Transcript_25764/g.12178  ORF Transcript_25764/g.12178 Transcript_25764/m.12178 type:complete len:93 (-) Transcript_25764:831-1109(-)